MAERADAQHRGRDTGTIYLLEFTMKRSIALAVPLAVALLLATPTVTQAQPAQAGPGFGQHVSQCARTMGFSGDHNPGIHHGLSGWDGMPC